MEFIQIPAFTPPGMRMNGSIIAQMIEFGRQIRDEHLWSYPLLPGAVYIHQQMASTREWKVSGKPRNVARAIEYINGAQTLTYDGTIEYGFEQHLSRRDLDHLSIGRKIFNWGIGKPLRYLDPTQVYYNLNEKKWVDVYTQEKFDPEFIVVDHPIPIGGNGNFVSPLSFIIPTAMLAWLIREHDRAAADGRKIRDIIIVGSRDMADSIEKAVKHSLQLWNGGDVTKLGVPMVYVDKNPGASGAGKVEDMIARLGLANIPEGFNREQFQFQYVNEISDAIGLALRYIWNSEKATNRALEEVQEARQSQKGPQAVIRTEQRLINQSGMLKQFGNEIRFAFVEEVDIASRESDAKVLKLYAESYQIFVKETGANVSIDQWIAWLKSKDMLPVDLEVLPGVVQKNQEDAELPDKGKVIRESDPMTTDKSLTEIDEGEIVMDGNGKIIDFRRKSFTFKDVLIPDLATAKPGDNVVSFESALRLAREADLRTFKELMSKSEIDDELAKSIYSRIDNLDERDQRQIHGIVAKYSA